MKSENKGITLIALILTIIILIILAVVALNTVNGDGIIKKAQVAKNNYIKAQETENGLLSYYLTQIEENTNDNASKKQETVSLNNKVFIRFNKDNEYNFIIFKNNKVTYIHGTWRNDKKEMKSSMIDVANFDSTDFDRDESCNEIQWTQYILKDYSIQEIENEKGQITDEDRLKDYEDISYIIENVGADIGDKYVATLFNTKYLCKYLFNKNYTQILGVEEGFEYNLCENLSNSNDIELLINIFNNASVNYK